MNEINNQFGKKIVEIITPQKEDEHGCQISILLPEKGRDFFNSLNKNGVIADWREPNVIRVTPVPLYNTFEEVFRFGRIIKEFAEKELSNEPIK